MNKVGLHNMFLGYAGVGGKQMLFCVIKALADTAREKICVLGKVDAFSDVSKMGKVANDLALFWGYDEYQELFYDMLDDIYP